MSRIVFFLVMCLILTPEAHAVRLMDGAAVGQMFGYVAACAKNVGMNPPATQEDKQIGEKYGMWLQNNGANVSRVLNDLQTNLGIGMATASRSNYSNCEGVLREMIGFHEFFKSKGTSLYPILEKYTSAPAREHNPGTVEEREDFLNFVQEQQKKEQQAKASPEAEVEEDMGPALPIGQLILKDEYTTATMKLRFNSDGDLMMMIKSTSSRKVDCTFEGMCEGRNGTMLVCTQVVDGKEITATGEYNDTSLELLPSSTKSICPKDGVIDGTYVKK